MVLMTTDLLYGMPGLSERSVMTNIQLYATQVVPRVRELLADREPAAPREPLPVGEGL